MTGGLFNLLVITLAIMFTPIREFPSQNLKTAVIAASSTVKVGDALIPGATGHNKYVKSGANTTGMLIGVCVAIAGARGKVLELSTATAGSGNETTPVYYAVYIPLAAPGLEFSATLSAAAGTTTDSDGIGSFNLSASDGAILDETSIALFGVTEKQFFSYGLDANDNTNKTVIGSFAKTLTP